MASGHESDSYKQRYIASTRLYSLHSYPIPQVDLEGAEGAMPPRCQKSPFALLCPCKECKRKPNVHANV